MNMADAQWIAACAVQLGERWRRVTPEQLFDAAIDLWKKDDLRALTPTDAAKRWLEPLRDGASGLSSEDFRSRQANRAS